MKHLSFDELKLPQDPDTLETVAGWLARGDGIAVYENVDLGHPELGRRQFVSFGSGAAIIESDTPPNRLPDIGSAINWRYYLMGVYRPEGNHEEHRVNFGTLHPDGTMTDERRIKQADIRRCPHLIMTASHYRDDGTCRCDDPTHLEMKEWGYVWDDESEQWA